VKDKKIKLKAHPSGLDFASQQVGLFLIGRTA